MKKTFIKYLIVIIITIIVTFLSFKSCERRKINELQNNINVLTDSITITKNKYKDIEYQNKILITDKNNLKKLNNNLYNELIREGKKIDYITKINASLNAKIDSIKNNYFDNIVVSIDTLLNKETITFIYDTIFSPGNEKHMIGNVIISYDKLNFIEYYTINGVDTIITKIPVINKDDVVVTIPKDSIVLSLVTGIKENKKDNSFEIFVRSNYPGFTVSKLDGAIIDIEKSDVLKKYIKPKKWGVGLQLGTGAIISYPSGIGNYGVYFGIGVSYNFIRF